MVKEAKKLINFRAPSQTVSDLEALAQGWSCSQTEAILRLISEGAGRATNGDGVGLDVQGEAQTIMRWWMRQDGMTEREVVEAALVIYDGFRQKQPQEIYGDGVIPGKMEGVVASSYSGPAPVDNRPKNATCKHCGEMFAGARFATICPGCKSLGHTLMPAECPRCTEGISI